MNEVGEPEQNNAGQKEQPCYGSRVVVDDGVDQEH
jgi:hypothetical protein